MDLPSVTARTSRFVPERNFSKTPRGIVLRDRTDLDGLEKYLLVLLAFFNVLSEFIVFGQLFV